MKLIWTRRALADLDRIGARIALDKPAIAAGFVTTITSRVERLKEIPLLDRIGVYADTRERVVHKNYSVTYRVRANEVQVLQVWHAARARAGPE